VRGDEGGSKVRKEERGRKGDEEVGELERVVKGWNGDVEGDKLRG